MRDYNILALGDCNTLGYAESYHNSFVEKFAKLVNKKVKNCGYTMSTTREMLYFYKEFYKDDLEIILVQYGLVDSWKTFKYSPYVLYYPDNFLRKVYRKIVKKYKKIARKFYLNKLFGEKFVVPLEEYRFNLEYVINNSKNQKVFLIETPPNKETNRNKYIKIYNKVLLELADKYNNCYVIKIYDELENRMDDFYLDNTHLNEKAYNFVANKIYEAYKKC